MYCVVLLFCFIAKLYDAWLEYKCMFVEACVNNVKSQAANSNIYYTCVVERHHTLHIIKYIILATSE
jgi:hypothetical protein